MESYLGKSENGREKEKKDSSTKNITTKGRKRRRSSSRDEEKEQEKNAEGEEEENEEDSNTKTAKGKTQKKQKVSSTNNEEERKLKREIAKLFEELDIPYPSDIRVATLKKFITKESGRKPKPATKIVLMQEIIDLMKAKLEQQQYPPTPSLLYIFTILSKTLIKLFLLKGRRKCK